MKTKKEIVKDWITRYTGVNIPDFGEYILLTNFQKYVDDFASLNNVEVDGLGKNMPSSTHKPARRSPCGSRLTQDSKSYSEEYRQGGGCLNAVGIPP